MANLITNKQGELIEEAIKLLRDINSENPFKWYQQLDLADKLERMLEED